VAGNEFNIDGTDRVVARLVRTEAAARTRSVVDPRWCPDHRHLACDGQPSEILTPKSFGPPEAAPSPEVERPKTVRGSISATSDLRIARRHRQELSGCGPGGPALQTKSSPDNNDRPRRGRRTPGFCPDLMAKIDYLRPLYDASTTCWDDGARRLLDNGTIKWRHRLHAGRTLNGSFISGQAKMRPEAQDVLTRIGFGEGRCQTAT